MSKNLGTGLKASGEDVFTTGQDAWNIADGFTKIKILRILIEIDLLETIALFGRKDLEEDVLPSQLNDRRVEALFRVAFCLRQLIGNTRFATDKRHDYAQVTFLMERLNTVDSVIDGCYSRRINDITKEETTFIHEEHFRLCFNIMRTIKDELNFVLNRNNLIFRHSDEVDLDKLMDDIALGG